MKPDPADTALERRKVWGELEEALTEGRNALLACDVARFEQCTEDQERCCERLATLGREPWGQTRALGGLRQRVRYLSQVQGALVRRALQSLCILRNLTGVHPYLAATRNVLASKD
jgi:hypothetical protein